MPIQLELINLTAHDICFEGGLLPYTLPPSGTVARLGADGKSLPSIEANGRYVKVATAQREIVGLPDPRPGVGYVVSTLVARMSNRCDVFCPDTGKSARRDGAGEVKGVLRLLQFG